MAVKFSQFLAETLSSPSYLVGYNSLTNQNVKVSYADLLSSLVGSGVVTGTGSATEVAFWTGTSAISSSSNLYWDNVANRLGVGTSSPSGAVSIVPAANTSAIVSSGYSVTGSGTTPLVNLTGTWNTTVGPTAILLNITNTASPNSSRLIDLQINSASVFAVTRSGILTSSSLLIAGSSVATGTSLALIDNAPSIDSFGLNNTRIVTPTGGNLNFINYVGSFQPNTATSAQFRGYNLAPTINQTGGANGITRGVYVNPTITSAFDWRSLEFTNNTGWGLYGSGTAENYLAGNLLLGTSVSTGQRLQVSGTSSFSPAANSSAIVSSGYSLTGSDATPMIDLSGTWNTTGTPTLIKANVTNTSSSINSLLMDLQMSGVSRFSISTTSAVYLGANIFAGFYRTNDGNTVSTSGVGIRFFANVNQQNSANFIFRSVNSFVATTGDQYNVNFNQNFSPTSGNAQFSNILSNPTINQTGGANGISRGILIAPSLTSAADFRAIETTQGSLRMSDTYLAGSGSLAGSLINLTQTWNTTGNPTAILLNVTNTASGGSSNLIDLQIGSLTRFRVNKSGDINSSGSVIASGFQSFSGTTSLSLTYYLGSPTVTATTGSTDIYRIAGGFAPTSGTGTYTGFNINPTINQTGGANGITRGLYVNPTLTSAADWRSIEWSNNTGFGLYGSGTAANYMNGNLLLGSTVDGGQRLQVTGTASITPAANSSALVSSGYSVTGSGTTSMINLSGTWNTSGNVTAFLMNITNTASGGSSYLMDLQTGGTSRFRITSAGGGQFASFLSNSSAGNPLQIRANTASLTSLSVNFTSTISAGSNPYRVIAIEQGFAPTSGTATFTGFNFEPTINQTGGANGITRGLYINPTLTSAADWRAIEVSAGGAYINTTSVQSSAILQADSTTKGFLPPRMTGAQAEAIATPAEGLLVYSTDGSGTVITAAGWWGYDGATWKQLN